MRKSCGFAILLTVLCRNIMKNSGLKWAEGYVQGTGFFNYRQYVIGYMHISHFSDILHLRHMKVLRRRSVSLSSLFQ